MRTRRRTIYFVLAVLLFGLIALKIVITVFSWFEMLTR